MKFTFASFRIQIQNILLTCLLKKVVRFLVSNIGRVEEVDFGAFRDCLDIFICMRVHMDITHPLRRIVAVKIDNIEEEIIILLQYEKLLDFSYSCVIMRYYL